MVADHIGFFLFKYDVQFFGLDIQKIKPGLRMDVLTPSHTQIVDDNPVMSLLNETIRHMRTNESGSAGDQYFQLSFLSINASLFFLFNGIPQCPQMGYADLNYVSILNRGDTFRSTGGNDISGFQGHESG